MRQNSMDATQKKSGVSDGLRHEMKLEGKDMEMSGNAGIREYVIGYMRGDGQAREDRRDGQKRSIIYCEYSLIENVTHSQTEKYTHDYSVLQWCRRTWIHT